jgi:hypothetical protein
LATDIDRADVSGFFFRELPHYQPAPELLSFLERGPPPVYIGFGSIVLQNPNEMLGMILDAVRSAGARAIISKGWSNLAVEDRDDVYLIGDCPHEWLFTRVAAVVHHGGAGTTACGLKNGKPTFVIPFFGEYVMNTLKPFCQSAETNAAIVIVNSSGDKWLQPRVLGPHQCHTDHWTRKHSSLVFSTAFRTRPDPLLKQLP